jgi:hypothetical protein
MRNRSKFRDLWTCNYCKKPGHIKADCRALKAKNEKFQQKGNDVEEENFYDSSSMNSRRTIGATTKDDPNILIVESMTEEVLLMTEEAASWLLDSGASYYITPF